MPYASAIHAEAHGQGVGAYFDQAATTFGTFYDRKRGAFLRWVDRKFRSDMFERFRLTFDALEPLAGASVLDVGCGWGMLGRKQRVRR